MEQIRAGRRAPARRWSTSSLDVARIEADQMTVSLEPVAVGAVHRGVDRARRGPWRPSTRSASSPPRRPGRASTPVADAPAPPAGDHQPALQRDQVQPAQRSRADRGGRPRRTCVHHGRPTPALASTPRAAATSSSRRSSACRPPAAPSSGTGLGLALSKRLVELMDGTLTVDTELGSGSEFRISLPLAEGPRPAGPEAPAEPERAPLTGHRPLHRGQPREPPARRAHPQPAG